MPRSALLLIVWLLAAPLAAQEAEPLKYWETHDGFFMNAAANLVLARNPYVIAARRLAASENPLLWPEWQFITDEALPLPDFYLREIKDLTPTPDFSGKEPIRRDDWAFYWLLNQALVLASETPEENFRKSAQEHENVQFPHLFGDPARYRGKVVPVRGELLVLREYPAPKPAQQKGIKVIYEGWIKGQTRHTNPYCVILTELPPGLKVAEKVNRDVVFYGYFLKKFRYPATGGDRYAPYLVGRTVELAGPSPAPADETPFSRMVLFAVAGGAFGLTVIAFGLSWWFRRGDTRIHNRLNQLREKHGLDFHEPSTLPLNEATQHQPAPPETGQSNGSQNPQASSP